MRDLADHCDSMWPPVRTRERAQPVSTIATADLIAAARAVIATERCTFLLIERIVRDGKVSIRIDAIFPDGDRRKGVTASGNAMMRSVCHAANATLCEVAVRALGGDSRRIGLMTDGVGVAYSPECASVLGDGWLGALLTGTVQRVDIAPFDSKGRWARLSALQHSGRAH